MEKVEHYLKLTAKVVCVLFALFQLYTVAFGQLPSIQQRLTHLTFALVLVFIMKPISKKFLWLRPIDFLFIIAAIIVGAYGFLEYSELPLRTGNPNRMDITISLTLLIIMLEATRRVIGLFLPILVSLFVFYAKFGYLFPGDFQHKGYSWARIANELFMTTNSIFGSALAASAYIVAIFVIFAAFLEHSGAGDAFLDVAYATFGKVRGGPAKVAVGASGLMGMVSGSAVANVAGTGSITIPLMKKVGLPPAFAGGVEAVASTGGQIMPPVMGAAAFIMAEVIGVPYGTIVLAAIIPAALYYLSLLIAVDSEAVKIGIKGMTNLPKAWPIFKKYFLYFVPLAVIIEMMTVQGFTPARSALFGTILIPIIAYVYNYLHKHSHHHEIQIENYEHRQTRYSLKDIIASLAGAGDGLVTVAVTCGCAGVVVGMMMMTGLGMSLSSILVNLSHGNLILLLLFTMISSLLLGMGLPTSACYIILSVLVAPAIVLMGVPQLAAHMFIFYFGVLANITPPVALAAFAGAAIAEANPFRTGVTATRLGLAGFIVPYYFIYRPEILLGTTTVGALGTLYSIGTLLLGVLAANGAISGVLFIPIPKASRILMGAAAVLLILPVLWADILGYACLAGASVFIYLSISKGKK